MRGALILLLAGSLLLASPAVAQTLVDTNHVAICFLDSDGTGGRARDEPVYLQLQACGNALAAGDVRLVPAFGQPGGTIVNGLDRDPGRITQPTTAGYAFVDLNGNGLYDAGDTMYVHFGTFPGSVSIGDIPLSGEGANIPLQPGDARAGANLVASPVVVGVERSFDLDGSGGYSTGDRVYLDMDSSASITVNDVRMAPPPPAPTPTATPSATPTATASPSATPTPPATATATPSDPPTATMTPVPPPAVSPVPSTVPPTGETDGDDNGAPPAAVATLVLAVLAAAGMASRRRDGT